MNTLTRQQWRTIADHILSAMDRTLDDWPTFAALHACYRIASEQWRCSPGALLVYAD